MPITKSAQKAFRQNVRRRTKNIKIKNKVKEVIKNFRLFCTQKKEGDARNFIPEVYSTLDKAAKTGVIKKNTASRKKSRLLKLFNSSFKK